MADDYNMPPITDIDTSFANITTSVELVLNPEFPTTTSPVIYALTAPTLNPISTLAIQAPAPFVGTVSVDNLLPEPFDDNPPEVAYGTVPSFSYEVAPEAPGVDVSYTMPVLDVTLPAAPSLLNLSIAPFSGISLPTITQDVPNLTAVAPDVVKYVPGQGYLSNLLTATQTTLLDRIQNGGTGLPPEAENALWDRQREREALATDTAILELERMETLGYAFPPGTFADARMKVTTEMAARTVSLGREIMIKQAELELANIQQSLSVATQLESTLINYQNQIEQRSFDAARYETEAGISVYNAKVQAYAAYVDAYKTKIAIYEAQIRGELAKVESYKTVVQAELAKAEINNALVNQYKVATEAALSRIEVFKAEVGAIQAKAEIEKLKISIYGEQIKAYTAKINSYTAEVEGYKATVQAEGFKQEAFKNKVQAYAAQVDAASKFAAVKIEEFKGRISAKALEWDGYKAASQAESNRVASLVAANQSIVDGYKAQILGVSSYNDTLTKQWQAVLEQSQRSAEIAVAASKVAAEKETSNRAISVEAQKSKAQVAAQLQAAIYNQYNFSEVRSNSTSSSTSKNTNTNISI